MIEKAKSIEERQGNLSSFIKSQIGRTMLRESENQKLKKKIILPKSLQDILQAEDRKLTNVIESCQESYNGTDPINDEQKIFKDLKMKQLGISQRERAVQLKNEKFRLVKDQNSAVIRDPLEIFGHGITQYFYLMSVLMRTLIIITLIFIPLMYYYS